MRALTVSRLTDPGVLDALVVEAERDGFRFVRRLVEEWRDGTNRFERPGEAIYVASAGDEVVGVGGLNVDPYIDDASVGRVRRLYVAVEHRRGGIASTLMRRVMDDARASFELLRLRTRNPEAAAFYERLGFARVEDDEYCTHQMRLTR